MLCIRQRLCQQGPIFLICSLLLLTGFLLQCRMLYKLHQRNQRMADYKEQLNELHDTMRSVEVVADNTEGMLRKLQRKVAHHKAPRGHRVS